MIYGRIQRELAAEIDSRWESTWLKQWSQAKLVLETGGRGISGLRRQFSASLAILMAMVGLLLLIVCANLANLLLWRGAVRQREIAVRAALGAARGRLIRQLLVENILLSSLGGGFGLLSAYWASAGLVRFLSTGRSPISLDLTPDLRVLSFTALLSIASGIFVGLLPALRSTRTGVVTALKDGGNVASPHQRFAGTLVVSQIALSIALVSAAGLFAESLQKLNSAGLGVRRDQVLTVRLEPKGSDQKRNNAQGLQHLYLTLLEHIRAVPTVMAAGLAGVSPTTPLQARTVHTSDGREFRISWTSVYPSYFETVGATVVEGRDFHALDLAAGAPFVTVINETFAQRAFHDKDPIGRKIVYGDETCEVIGVVKDVQYANLRGEVGGAMYLTFLQAPTGRGQMVLHVRFAGSPEAVIPEIRRQVSGIDPNLPAFEIRSLETEVAGALIRERLLALMSTCFGTVAALLAAVGLYGVMACSVTRRTKEIGIRMALGASRREIQRLVLGQACELAAAGVLLGAPMLLIGSRFIESFLYGVKASEPTVLVGSAALFVVIALGAGFLPSYRASRIDPMAALRRD